MKKTLAATLMLTALTAAGCMSSSPSMMMSDRSMMTSDGRMMMSESDGTSRAMTDQEMNDHMAMMMRDPRVSAMMMDRMKNDPQMSSMMSSTTMDKCKGMMSSGMSSGGERMMMMNSDGSTREMTDAELRNKMNMMMKDSRTSKMMSDAMMQKCAM